MSMIIQQSIPVGIQGHNYYIEDFPKCVIDIERHVLIRDIFPQLQELTSKPSKRFHYTTRQSRLLSVIPDHS